MSDTKEFQEMKRQLKVVTREVKKLRETNDQLNDSANLLLLRAEMGRLGTSWETSSTSPTARLSSRLTGTTSTNHSAPPRSGGQRHPFRLHTGYLSLDEISEGDRAKFIAPGEQGGGNWLRGEVTEVRNDWVHVLTDNEGGRARHRRAHKLKWDEEAVEMFT